MGARGMQKDMVGGELFKKRTQEEWKAYLSDQWTDLRIFVQENGEKAAVLGCAFGIVIVVFFKLFVFLVCLGALALLLLAVTDGSAPRE